MKIIFIKGIAINLDKVSTIEINKNKNGAFITFAGQNLFKAFSPGEDMSQEEFETLKEAVLRIVRNYEAKGLRPGQ